MKQYISSRVVLHFHLVSVKHNPKLLGWVGVQGQVSEYIWLATCQGKIYENKPPSATHETI